MKYFGVFNKNHISIQVDIIRFLSIIWGFEIGYFGGMDDPDFGILNFYLTDNTLYVELLQIHKFSITIILRLTFLESK